MDWQRQAKSIEAIAGYGWSFNFLVQSDGSESMEGMWVTGDYFRLLGLEPMLGRTFLESETGATPAPVITLGYDLWQRKFNGDRNIVGKTIRMSRWDTPAKVIGVMPSRVRFLPSPGASQEPHYNLDAPVDFWIPAGLNANQMKNRMRDVAARVKKGFTLAQAQAELNRDGRRILFPLSGAAALVLLIACGNVAALLLVRGLQRQQEFAVRSSLGVGRTALLRQVSSEALLPAFSGGRSAWGWHGE